MSAPVWNYTAVFWRGHSRFDVSRSSIGGALQIGIDIPVSNNMFFNIDLKKGLHENRCKKLQQRLCDNAQVDRCCSAFGLG